MSIELKKQVIDILKILQEKDIEIEASKLADELNVDYIVLMSAINDLIDNNLGGFREEEMYQVSLSQEGLTYLEKGLPERQILQILLKNEIKEINLDDLRAEAKLDENLFYVGISNLKKNKWVTQSKATGENKIFLIAEEFPETQLEKFLKKFESNEIVDYSTLSKEELMQFDVLNKRKLMNKVRKTQRIIYLTKKGKSIPISEIQELKQVSKITSEMLSSGTWKKYNLKPFDVTKPGPLLKAGKIHPLVNLINEIREIFLSMGFIEIRGPIIESAFYNFDALFQPQDHPAREIHDIYFVKHPSNGDGGCNARSTHQRQQIARFT